MAMNLRLTDEESELLRRTAEAEHRSMNEVVRLAIVEHAERVEHRSEVRRIAADVIERRKELLDRLRDS